MAQTRKRFMIELIKPSHYDDDGYVIQWWRGFIPSNSLSALYGIVVDACERRVLGQDVDIKIEARDETNATISIRRIIRRFKRNGNVGLVCFVGVQTNQFPRAMDMAWAFRAAGLKVAIGGFHVSGSLAMLPELTPELHEASELGITLFAGEAENHFGDLLRAAYEDRSSRSTILCPTCPNSPSSRYRSCRGVTFAGMPERWVALTPVAAAHSAAHFALSSMSRAVSRGFARQMISSS